MASQIYAGLDGMEQKRDPGPSADTPYETKAPLLPKDLGEALAALRGSEVFRKVFGESFVDYYAHIKEAELARFKTALYSEEPKESPIRWNAYVLATIAFLERDREALVKQRDTIATGPKFQGAVPNLEVVDRLIKYFDEPYAVAYSGKAKRSK